MHAAEVQAQLRIVAGVLAAGECVEAPAGERPRPGLS